MANICFLMHGLGLLPFVGFEGAKLVVLVICGADAGALLHVFVAGCFLGFFKGIKLQHTHAMHVDILVKVGMTLLEQTFAGTTRTHHHRLHDDAGETRRFGVLNPGNDF